MYAAEKHRKLKMIVEEIKNSIKNALFAADKNLVLYFERPLKTDFPYAILLLKDFKIEPANIFSKKHCFFEFEFIFQKSTDNKPFELLDLQEKISKVFSPSINILGRQITLENIQFLLVNKQLIMKFNLDFYLLEKETETEQMQTLDITLRGE